MSTKISTISLSSIALALIAGSIVVPATYAATDGTTINVEVNSAISISTSGTVDLAIVPTGAGVASSASDSVKVSTNSPSGYKLQLSDSDAANVLSKGSDTIAETSGTFSAPAALDVNSWGYRIDDSGSPFGAGPTAAETNQPALTGTWAKVPVYGAADTLKTTSSTAVNDTTTVWYGAKVSTSLPNGLYKGAVTYTASVN